MQCKKERKKRQLSFPCYFARLLEKRDSQRRWEKLYNRQLLKILLPWRDTAALQTRSEWVSLPSFHCRSAAALASPPWFPRALRAREQLGHELRDIWKLRVGVQHVHGLLHFLKDKRAMRSNYEWVSKPQHFGQRTSIRRDTSRLEIRCQIEGTLKCTRHASL